MKKTVYIINQEIYDTLDGTECKTWTFGTVYLSKKKAEAKVKELKEESGTIKYDNGDTKYCHYWIDNLLLDEEEL